VVKKPTVQERLDIGFEIVECLVIYKKPLPDELIARYLVVWRDSKGGHTTYRNARQYLDKMVDLLSRCVQPVPRLVMEQVCMCSSESIKLYNSLLLTPIRLKVMSREIWDSFEAYEMPRFEDVMIYAVTHKLVDEITKIN